MKPESRQSAEGWEKSQPEKENSLVLTNPRGAGSAQRIRASSIIGDLSPKLVSGSVPETPRVGFKLGQHSTATAGHPLGGLLPISEMSNNLKGTDTDLYPSMQGMDPWQPPPEPTSSQARMSSLFCFQLQSRLVLILRVSTAAHSYAQRP